MDAIKTLISQHIGTIYSITREEIEFNMQKSEFGDFSTNICMKLAKKVGKSPVSIATDLSNQLSADSKLNSLVVTKSVGPYLNFHLTNAGLASLLESSPSLNLNFHKGKKIMFEFGQPNTHKAMHIGHIRSAVTGLSLSNLLENLGYEVVRANYFGDVGLQVAKCLVGANIFLSNSNYLKALLSSEQVSSLELLDEGKTEEEVDIGEIELDNNSQLPEISQITEKDLLISPENNDIVQQNVRYLNSLPIDIRAKLIDKFYSFGSKVYKENEKLIPFIRDINKKIYEKDSIEVKFLYDATRQWSIDHQDELFETLGIKYDRQYPESEIWRLGYEIVTSNIGNIFKVDTENGNSVILDTGKLTEEEKKRIKTFVYLTYDRILTYSGKEMGLAKLKTEEYPGLEKIIYTTSVEQSDYFRNAFKALELLGLNPDGKKLVHVAFGWLLRNNKKQSSRMGDSIKGLDVIEEIITKVKENMKFDDNEIATKLALASLKFLILSHEIHTDINYDLDTFVSFDGFSGIYVMYAYVRCLSILNQVNKGQVDSEKLSSFDYEFNEVERNVLLHLANFEYVMKVAGENLEPHKICHYVYDLAVLMNRFYSESKILVEDDTIRQVRINILRQVSTTIKHSMWLLGIDVVEKM